MSAWKTGTGYGWNDTDDWIPNDSQPVASDPLATSEGDGAPVGVAPADSRVFAELSQSFADILSQLLPPAVLHHYADVFEKLIAVIDHVPPANPPSTFPDSDNHLQAGWTPPLLVADLLEASSGSLTALMSPSQSSSVDPGDNAIASNPRYDAVHAGYSPPTTWSHSEESHEPLSVLAHLSHDWW